MSDGAHAPTQSTDRLAKTLEGMSPKYLFADLIAALADAPDTAREIVGKLEQVVDAVKVNSATDVTIDVSVCYDTATHKLDYGFRVRGRR